MRPIIEYHGPLFQWLSKVAMLVGYPNVAITWQVGVVLWLSGLSALVLSKRFPRVFTGVLLAGMALLRLPGLGMVEQNVDESQWIASAATLVRDPYFWRSVDGTTSGPLNVWPPALLYYLGLSLDYATLRLWGLLTCVLPTAWLLLATFRRQFGERIARLAILPAAICLALTTDPDGVAFNSEQLPMLLLALTGYLLSRFFTGPRAAQPAALSRLLVLGLVLGCLPYTKLQATPIGLVVAVWVLVGLLTGLSSTGPGGVQRVGLFVLGGLLPTVLVGAYLISTDLTDYAIRSYVLTNLEYAQTGSWGAGTVSWTDRLRVRMPQIYGTMRSTNWFWRLALFLSAVSFGNAYLQFVKTRRADSRLWFTVTVCLVSLYATLQPGNPFPHYQWLSFVPVSWLIGGLLNGLIAGPASLVQHQRPSNRRWQWVIGGSCLIVGFAYPTWVALSRPNPGIRQVAVGGWHSPTRAISEAIRLYARPNEGLVVWGWVNSIHVETGLLMGSRFIPLYFPVVPGPQQAYFLDVYRQDLLINRPAVFVDAAAIHVIGDYKPYPIRRYPAIQTILDKRYQLVKIVGGAKIYTLREEYRSDRPVQDLGHVHYAYR